MSEMTVMGESPAAGFSGDFRRQKMRDKGLSRSERIRWRRGREPPTWPTLPPPFTDTCHLLYCGNPTVANNLSDQDMG